MHVFFLSYLATFWLSIEEICEVLGNQKTKILKTMHLVVNFRAPVGLVEVRVSWSGHLRLSKKKKNEWQKYTGVALVTM